MGRHADIAAHPGMHAASHGEKNFLGFEPLVFVLSARRLGLVPGRIDYALRVNVMVDRIAVQNFELLAFHNSEDVRRVDATLLIELRRFRRWSPACPGQAVFNPDEYVPESPVRIDHPPLTLLRPM